MSKRAIIWLPMGLAVLLLLGDPYTWQMSLGDLLVTADGIWWQSLAGAVEIAMLMGTALAFAGHHTQTARLILLSEGSLFSAVNLGYFMRDGLDRLSGGPFPVYVLALLLFGVVARFSALMVLHRAVHSGLASSQGVG